MILPKYKWTTFKFFFTRKASDSFYSILSAEYLNKDDQWAKMKYNPKISIPEKYHGLDKYESNEFNYYYHMKLIYDAKFDKIYTFEEYEEEKTIATIFH
jgi:hypothetical protein